MSVEFYQIAYRKQVTVNTDPQRRCYDGCHASSELRQTPWEHFGRYRKEDAEHAIATFQHINPSREYKLAPGRRFV